MHRKALGRGLESLIKGIESTQIRHIPLNKIKTNPYQPRKHFNEHDIKELAISIKENGVLQPIIVRNKSNYYEIIAGERRYRASKIAGLKEIPAIIKNVDDKNMLKYAIIENIQREDLNPIEEARGYNELINTYKYTHKQIGEIVGKSRAYITNLLRILELEKSIIKLIEENKLSLSHAKVLLSIKGKNRRIMLAKACVKNDISVRDLERQIEKKSINKKHSKDKNILYIEELLSKQLNRKIKITYKRSGKGKIILEFYNNDDFEELLKVLGLKRID